MTPDPLRVVLDTSVMIHYLIRPGAAIRCIVEELWFEDEIIVVFSPELLVELEEVLGRESIRQYIHQADSDALLDVIRAKAEFITGFGEIPVYTRDPKDDKFIACAVAGDVSYLISLDKDILVLGKLGNIQFITPYDFIQKIRP